MCRLSARDTTTRKHVISSSDESSDDEMPGQKSKSKKTKVTEKEDVQDTLKEMKQMLRVLCEKVDRNEKCLKELKTRPRSVFQIWCKMHYFYTLRYNCLVSVSVKGTCPCTRHSVINFSLISFSYCCLQRHV